MSTILRRLWNLLKYLINDEKDMVKTLKALTTCLNVLTITNIINFLYLTYHMAIISKEKNLHAKHTSLMLMVQFYFSSYLMQLLQYSNFFVNLHVRFFA